MARKIFVNYRREDARADARNIRDRLANVFGASNVFMDVDNLQPGQRFDLELAKALAQCDVFLVVIGPRWGALLEERARSMARDYVRDEIAAALSLGITVIPVLIERTPLPPDGSLPPDIRALVMHQKQDVVHERFGRDMAELIEAIKDIRRRLRRPLPWRTLAVASAAVMLLVVAVFIFDVLRPRGPPLVQPPTARPADTKRTPEPAAKKKTEEEAERHRAAKPKAPEDLKRADVDPKASPAANVPDSVKMKGPPPALKAAMALMSSGAVRAARQQLLAMAADGSPDVAWALARSYDPNFLGTIPAADASPDIGEASRWYRAWHAGAVKEGLVDDSVSLERIIRAMRQ